MQEEIKPTPKPQKTLLGVVVVAIIAIVLAGYVGWSLGHRAGFKKAETETKATYEETVSAFMPPMPEEQTYFSGTVEKIENKTLYVKGAKPTTEFLEMGQEITMKVKVTDATKIFKLTMVAPEEITPPAEGEELMPPEPFKREEKKFEDLKEGMSLSVTAAENIIGKEEFEATEVQISEMF